MSTRIAKQVIYAAFYIVLWALIIWVGYKIFVHPAPPAPPAPTVQPVEVINLNVFSTDSAHDTFLAKVANPNANFAAEYVPFSFDQIDASGTVLQSFPGASFLYPNEVKYVVLVNQAIAQTAEPGTPWVLTIPTSTEQWVASSSFGAAPELVVQNVSTQVGSSTVLVTGQILSQDTAAFNNIFIIAVFKDANGNPIAASQTELDSIAPDQAEGFSVSYPAIPGVNPAATEVDAYAERQ
jgi:hypothetical protein